jgi:hypothetical protein
MRRDVADEDPGGEKKERDHDVNGIHGHGDVSGRITSRSIMVALPSVLR